MWWWGSYHMILIEENSSVTAHLFLSSLPGSRNNTQNIPAFPSPWDHKGLELCSQITWHPLHSSSASSFSSQGAQEHVLYPPGLSANAWGCYSLRLMNSELLFYQDLDVGHAWPFLGVVLRDSFSIQSCRELPWLHHFSGMRAHVKNENLSAN